MKNFQSTKKKEDENVADVVGHTLVWTCEVEIWGCFRKSDTILSVIDILPEILRILENYFPQ